MDQLVLIGKVLRAHGVKGEVAVELINPQTSLFSGKIKIYIKDIKKQFSQTFICQSLRGHGKLIMHLEGVENRDVAESLSGFEIFVDRSSFPPLAEGEYYLHDVVGFHVVDELGKLIGVITSFDSNGFQDLVCITDLKDQQKMIHCLPWIDDFFPTIDWDLKNVVMKKTEYI